MRLKVEWKKIHKRDSVATPWAEAGKPRSPNSNAEEEFKTLKTINDAFVKDSKQQPAKAKIAKVQKHQTIAGPASATQQAIKTKEARDRKQRIKKTTKRQKSSSAKNVNTMVWVHLDRLHLGSSGG